MGLTGLLGLVGFFWGFIRPAGLVAPLAMLPALPPTKPQAGAPGSAVPRAWHPRARRASARRAEGRSRLGVFAFGLRGRFNSVKDSGLKAWT